jgi:VanZ family protein
MRRDLLLAVTASLAVILGAPYIGQIRGRVQEALPGQYRIIVATIVVGAAIAALIAAVARIRERRVLRYASLAAAFLIAIAYARATRTGNADRDLVEQFHFVEYGVVTYLFYRVWRRRGDRASLALPLCAGLVVGIADEWFQWFIPSRVGELRDVFINAVAVGCGVLFSVGVHPFRRAAASATAKRLIAVGVAAVVLAAAVFLDSVHIGHLITDPRVGSFRSQFDAAALTVAATDRAARWRTEPPRTGDGIAREDHYLAEGQWHVQRRNEAAAGTDGWRAWHENMILETFFAPVLDLGSRWSEEARAQAERHALPDHASYVSNAEPYRIYAMNKWLYWSVTMGLLVAIWIFRG